LKDTNPVEFLCAKTHVDFDDVRKTSTKMAEQIAFLANILTDKKQLVDEYQKFYCGRLLAGLDSSCL
jgi:hypothetical protein